MGSDCGGEGTAARRGHRGTDFARTASSGGRQRGLEAGRACSHGKVALPINSGKLDFFLNIN